MTELPALWKKLADGNLRRIKSFDEWNRLWNSASTFEEHLSLIHWGLKDGKEKWHARAEIVCAYLDIVSQNGSLSITDSLPSELVKHGEVRLIVRAAWKELCLLYLKNCKDVDGRFPIYGDNGMVLRKLVRFFDPTCADMTGLFEERWTPEDIREISNNFLAAWIWAAWDEEPVSRDPTNQSLKLVHKYRTLLHSQRPVLVHWLARGLGGTLRTLLEFPAYQDVMPILKEYALREETHRAFPPNDRSGPYLSIDDAIAGGRVAAEVYKILEIRLRAS